jgi:predicted DNA-binding ribbon-helix-helix protein
VSWTAIAATRSEGLRRGVTKRSITIASHRTSVSLEQPFWEALSEIAVTAGKSVAAIVAEVDRTRASPLSLSAALRLYVLAWYRGKAGLRSR